MSQIHILDKYNFEVKEVLSNKQDSKVVLEDTHTRNIEKHSETYDFVIDYRASEHLENRDRVLIPDEDKGQFREFIINKMETDTYDGETEIFSEASYLEDLQKAKAIEPQELDQTTPQEAVAFALRGTGWEVGDVEYTGFRTISWSSYNTPYEVLKIFATRFESQLDFTIETRGNKVTKRLVHLRQPKNLFKGKEIRRGKDLADLTRTTLSTDVVTALVALAPEPEDKTKERLVIEIKDDEAQAKWGKAYNYIWGLYEPESDNTDMTEERLRTLAKTELNKHNKPKVEYSIEAISIEEQFPHERVRIGDKIRLKDDLSKPFFYVDATVKEVTRSVFNKDSKSYVLGEITEHQRMDLRKHFNALLSELRERLKETDSNLDNIVTIIDEEVERRIHKGETPPDNPINDQLWLDLSNPDNPVLKRYWNGEWIEEITAVNKPEDIGAISREQAMFEAILSSFENLKAVHAQLLAESNTIKLNKYINQTHIDNINAKLQTVIDTFNVLDSEISKHKDASKITLEESNYVHQLMLDYSTAVSNLRTSITEATNFATAHLEYLQSKYTDEKYDEAMGEVAETFGLTYEDGVLTGNAVLMSDLETTREDLENQLTTTKNTLNDMINSITGDSRNMLIGTSLIDPTHFSIQGGGEIHTDEPIDYVRIHKEASSEEVNQIDETTNIQGTRITTDGVESTDNAHTTTALIPVSPDTNYYWRTTNSHIEAPRIIFYGTDSAYIEGKLFDDADYINFRTPSDTYYIRLTAPTDTVDASWVMNKGVYMPPTETDEAYILFHNKMDYQANETYTLALDFRSEVVDELDYIFLETDKATHILHETMTPAPFKLDTSGEWSRHYMQFTPTQDIKQAQFKVGTDYTGDAIGHFDLRQIHLYKGTSEMAWQPAPEDNRQYITQISRELVDLEYKISTKLTRADYDILNEEITSLNTEVTQTAEAIIEKADKSVVDAIDETVTNHDTQIKTHAEGIETLINKTETQGNELTTVTNKTNETAEGLEQTITKVTDAEDAISQAQADIKTNTEEISSKLATATYTTDKESILTSLEAANSERTQLADEIRDKVTLTDYESYKASTGTLGDANKDLYVEHSKKGKWLRLATNEGDRAYGRFIIADKTSSQHGTVEFNASVLFNRVENAEFIVNSFSKMTSFPFTKARFLTKDTYDEQYLDIYFDPTRDTTNTIAIWLKDNIQESGWVLQELPEAEIPSEYTSTEYEISESASTKGVLTEHATSITQNGKQIALKAEQSELDSVNKTLSEQYSELSLDSETIKGEVSGLSDNLAEVTTTVTQTKDAFDVSIVENNTKFTQITDNIAEKVGKAEVVTSINASTEGIKIDADKIELTANSSISLAIDNARKYADTTASTAEDNAKRYAESLATEAENAAKAHADAKAEAERVKAEAHADGIVTAEEKARIKDVEAKLELAKSHAETKATEAEEAATKVADAAQSSANTANNKAIAADGKASTANSKIDNLKVSGRNLLHDSGDAVSTSNYIIQDYYLTQEIPEGTEVTVSFKAKIADGKSYFRLYNSGGSVSMGKNFAPTNRGEYEVYTHTFNWNVGTSSNEFLRVYHMPSSASGASTIEWIQLEAGNRATEWRQAPEDMVEKKKIISEINLSEEGVQIQGDKVDITAGSNIRIAIDDAKEDAISTASKDATQKANSAEEAAKSEATKAQKAADSAKEVAEEARETINSDEFMTVKSNYHNSTSIAAEDTGKWVRIAYNNGSRAHGRFILRDTTSAQHGVAVFEAGINYGNNPYINLTSYGRYSDRSFTKARVVHKSTYDQVYLEVYLDKNERTQSLAYWLTDNIQQSGWVGLDWTDGGVPTNYTTFNKELNEDTVVSQVADTAKKIADSKVAPDEVIPSINLDKTGVQIEGDKIDLSAGSAIKVAIDAAEKNANVHTNDSIDNMQVGGVNLIPKTDFSEYINPPAGWVRWGTGGYLNNRIQFGDYLLVQNDTLTATIGMYSDNLIENVVEGQTYTLSYLAAPSAQVDNSMNYNFLMNADGANYSFPEPEREVYGSIGSNTVYKYTTTRVAPFGGQAYILIGSETLKQDVYGYIYMSKPQLEIGNKATAWSRAFRDSVSKERIISEINLDKSGTKISGDMVDIKANDINFKANEQFNLVVGDVQDALADAKKAQSTADKAVPKSGVVTAINASKESMKISADKLELIGGKSISIRLNNADKAAEKAQNTAEDAVSDAKVAQGTAEGAIEDLNNMDFSGTNMLQYTNFRDLRNINKMGAPWGNGSKYYQSKEEYLLVSTSNAGSQLGMRTYKDELYFEPNQEYTLSFKAYSSGYTTGDFDYVYIYRPDGSNEGSFHTKRTKLGKAPQSSYDLYEYKVTFKSTKDHDKPAQMLIADTTTSQNVPTWIRIKDIMLQKGNKATPYALHPSEVVEKRSIIPEINLNDQGAKIQGDKIKLVAGDEISLEIADTRKKVINSNVANNNLIPNTDFWNNSDRFYDSHSITGATTSGIIAKPPMGKGWLRMVRNDGDLSYIWTHNSNTDGSNRFSVKAGQDYTFSILVAQNYMGNDLNYVWLRRVYDSAQIRVNNHQVKKTRIGDVWGRYVYKYEFTFVCPFTSNDTVMFFGFNNSSENNRGYYLSEWKLEEGTEATAYTEDHATKQDLISQINMDDSGVQIQGNQIDIIGNATFSSTKATAESAHSAAWNSWNRTGDYEAGIRAIHPNVMKNWGVTNIAGGRIQTDQMRAKRVDIYRKDAYYSNGTQYGVYMNDGMPNSSYDLTRNTWIQGGNMVEWHNQGYMFNGKYMKEDELYSVETIYTTHHARYLTISVGYNLDGDSSSVYALGSIYSFGDGNYGTVTSRKMIYRDGDTVWDTITIDLGVPDYKKKLAFYLRFGQQTLHYSNRMKVRINRVYMWG